MDFYTKIKELEYIHSKIEHEKKDIERRMETRKEYKRLFIEARQQELEDELAKLEQMKI